MPEAASLESQDVWAFNKDAAWMCMKLSFLGGMYLKLEIPAQIFGRVGDADGQGFVVSYGILNRTEEEVEEELWLGSGEKCPVEASSMPFPTPKFCPPFHHSTRVDFVNLYHLLHATKFVSFVSFVRWTFPCI